jgi:hypothetical protein
MCKLSDLEALKAKGGWKPTEDRVNVRGIGKPCYQPKLFAILQPIAAACASDRRRSEARIGLIARSNLGSISFGVVGPTCASVDSAASWFAS